MYTKVVAIDLDNTLAEYSGWKNYKTIGKFIESSRRVLELFIKNKWEIVIYTTRADYGVIREWIKENNLPIKFINHSYSNANLDCSNAKPIAELYIDDRSWPLCGKTPDWDEIEKDLIKKGILIY